MGPGLIAWVLGGRGRLSLVVCFSHPDKEGELRTEAARGKGAGVEVIVRGLMG